MDSLVIIMIIAFILSIVSGVSFYYRHKSDVQERTIKKEQLDTQSSYIARLDELAMDKKKTRQERISIVLQLSQDSAADLTVDEAYERIETILKHYQNNVFKEQLAKSFYAIPHLFRIQSTRIFMDEMADLNEDIEAGEVADVLADFESITLMIYERTHDWNHPTIQSHLQSIQENIQVIKR